MMAEDIYKSVWLALPIVIVHLVVLVTLWGLLVPLFDAEPLMAYPFVLLVRLFTFILLPVMPLFYTLQVYLKVKNRVGFGSSIALGTWTVFLALIVGWNWVAAVIFILAPSLFAWVLWLSRIRHMSTGTAAH